MSRLRMFFRCIGEAVCAKGLRALLSLVPLGEAAFDIAYDTYDRFKRQAEQKDELAAIAAAAQATLEETRQEAVAVARELAVQEKLPPEAEVNLVSYLMQVPSTVRQTMKRPSDPAGKTVPASFTLRRPEQLVTMLPQRLPSFKAGDRPAGIGNWELVELLGAGGFGEVWLARHPTLHGVTAALKFCLDEQAAQSLRHEAGLLDRLMRQERHPGIVPLRQAYLDAVPLCLEYEYVSGGDLAALLNEWQRGGRVPTRQVNMLLLRLAEIVGHAHRLNPPIVHRDLKPANVLVERTSSGTRLRVTDFGIGGLAASRTLRTQTVGTSAALATSLRGAHTPLYASPQQVRGDDPDPRDDVHALGVMWYQMLVGDLTGGVPADWADVLEGAGQDKELIGVLGLCVSRPEKRFADAVLLAARLGEILEPKAVLAVEAVEEIEEDVPTAEAADVPVAKLAPPTVRPLRQQQTQRPERAVTRRAPAEVVPPPPPAQTQSTAGPRPGNQFRRFAAAGVTLADVQRELSEWLRGEGFRTQDLRTEDGGSLIQIEQEGTWRKFVGMSTALNIILRQDGDEITVEIGAGQWLDKAAAGVVSLFLLWPLAVTAAIGAWAQMKMPERVFGRVGEVVSARRKHGAATPTGLSSDAIARLRELATLRDQGILSDEEFAAEKARLLGR